MLNGRTLSFCLTLSVVMSAATDRSTKSLNVTFKTLEDLSTTKGPPPDEVDKLFRDYFLWKLKNNPQKATAAGFVEFSDQVNNNYFYSVYFILRLLVLLKHSLRLFL